MFGGFGGLYMVGLHLATDNSTRQQQFNQQMFRNMQNMTSPTLPVAPLGINVGATQTPARTSAGTTRAAAAITGRPTTGPGSRGGPGGRGGRVAVARATAAITGRLTTGPGSRGGRGRAHVGYARGFGQGRGTTAATPTIGGWVSPDARWGRRCVEFALKDVRS